MFRFHRPAQRHARRARATLGRADGNASHPTMNRASGTRKGTDMDAYATQQKNSETRLQAPAGPLQSVGPTAEAMAPGLGRTSLRLTRSVDPIGNLRGRHEPSWVPSVTGGGWTRSTRRRSSCWTACRPPSVSGCRAFRLVRTRWKPVSSSQGAPFRRTACRSSIRIRLPGLGPGPDAMGSVSSAYALAAAGGRLWRPWCRTSERASADTGHNFR